jgi:hypothetical protein
MVVWLVRVEVFVSSDIHDNNMAGIRFQPGVTGGVATIVDSVLSANQTGLLRGR